MLYLIQQGGNIMAVKKKVNNEEIEGAMSSLALVVTGLMTVLAVPLFAKFL